MRLIDAEELERLFNEQIEQGVGVIGAFDAFADALQDTPTVDAAPVVHGRWEDSIDEWFGTDVYTCSKCRESYVLVEGTPKQNLWHYCPNCGAKMDGGDGDAVD